MAAKTFTIERVFNTGRKEVWRALTEKNLMKQWYFDLPEFKAVVGFVFEFTGGPTPEKQYQHYCEITEVIPEVKMTHTWCFKGYEGISYLTFELFDENENTRLKLTHSGIESFPAEVSDFSFHNFEEGWNRIINISLTGFLEKTKLKTNLDGNKE